MFVKGVVFIYTYYYIVHFMFVKGVVLYILYSTLYVCKGSGIIHII